MQAFLQSVPARVGAWRGGRWGQSDGGRELHWVVHRQDQSSAPDRHFVLRQGELVIQAIIAPGTGGGGVLAVDGAGSGRVGADSDVSVH